MNVHERELFIFCSCFFIWWHHFFMNTSVGALFVYVRLSEKNKPTSNPVWSCPRWGTYCVSVITNNKWETQSGSESDSHDGRAVNRIILGSKCDSHLAEVWRVQSAPHQCSAFFPLGLRYTLAGHGANCHSRQHPIVPVGFWNSIFVRSCGKQWWASFTSLPFILKIK